jgi:acetyl esterase/lipase
MSPRVLGSVVMIVVLGGVGAGPERPAEPNYPHASFTAQEYGEGPKSYWMFEPSDPRPESAPVVVFNHGWLAVNPGVYGAWIEHLTRSGKIVIFPRYQGDWSTNASDFLPNAIAAVRDALDVLHTAPGHARPQTDRFAAIGHSAGGNLAALMAASAHRVGLPQFRAVVSVLPGELKPIREPALADVPAKTILVVVAADRDLLVGDIRARQIFTGTTAIPLSRKKFVLYRTDRQGPIPILADHLAPTAGLARLDTGEGPFRYRQMSLAGVDILDRYGFWRMADLAMETAFAGLTLDETTHDGELLRDLGRWGDGRRVTPPIVGDDLSSIPRVLLRNGARLVPLDPDDYFGGLLSDRP